MTALGYVWQPEATTMDGPFTYLVSVDLGFPSKPGDQLSQVLRTQVQTPISRLGETWNLHRLVIYSCTISQSSLQDQNFGGVLEVIFLTFKVILPPRSVIYPVVWAGLQPPAPAKLILANLKQFSFSTCSTTVWSASIGLRTLVLFPLYQWFMAHELAFTSNK